MIRSTTALCLAAVAAASVAPAQTWIAQSSGTTASLRGVSAVSPSVVWASGAGGAYLRTLDGGATWHAAAVPGAGDLDFRGLRALDSHTAWLMSSGPGEKSRIYRTADGGAHWSPLHTNPDAGGFFDALAFWDARRGIVLGDPVDGQFVILTTADGGATWQRRKLPPALPNEGAFAASNSCLPVRGKREVWFGTGGPSGARVFHSHDGGENWEVAGTPLRHAGFCRPARRRRGWRRLRQARRSRRQRGGNLRWRAHLGCARRHASERLPLRRCVSGWAQGLDRRGNLRFRYIERRRPELGAFRWQLLQCHRCSRRRRGVGGGSCWPHRPPAMAIIYSHFAPGTPRSIFCGTPSMPSAVNCRNSSNNSSSTAVKLKHALPCIRLRSPGERLLRISGYA